MEIKRLEEIVTNYDTMENFQNIGNVDNKYASLLAVEQILKNKHI